MTGIWKKLPKPQPSYTTQLASTTCDRCGAPSSIVNEPRTRAWGEVFLHIQGEPWPHHADLCMDCSNWLFSQINASARLLGGAGMQDYIAFVNEPGDSQSE